MFNTDAILTDAIFFFLIQLIIVAESAGIYSKAIEAHCTGIER